LAYRVVVKQNDLMLPEHDQHRSWRWCEPNQILQDDTVIRFTQAYFA